MTVTVGTGVVASACVLAGLAGCAARVEPVLEVDQPVVELPVGRDANVNFYVIGEADDRAFVDGDPHVARVMATDTGIEIIGLAPGRTMVQVEDDGLWGTIRVDITPAIFDKIYLDPAALELAVGDSAEMTCVASYTDTTAFDVTSDCGWTSEDVAVVTFEEDHVVAHQAGHARIHARYLESEFVAEVSVHL